LTIATETGLMSNGLPQIPLYSKDGRIIVLSGGIHGTILTFDAGTGAAGVVYDGHKGPGGVQWLTLVGADRVASGGFDNKHALWDMKTSKRLDDLKFPELPPLPAGRAGHAGLTSTVSPGGRYTVLARKEAGRPVVPGPLRVLDTSTGEVVLKADWNGGRVVFTADESRVLVLDGLGKATWYKLPSGEEDGGWATGAGLLAERARILGATADGKTVLYQGPLAGQLNGVYLLDGATGKALRMLEGAPYQASFSALSPDGRFVAMVVIDFNRGPTWYADVYEVATWHLVGRAAPPEKGAKEVPQFGFSPDGKHLAIFYPQAKELRAFLLPDAAAPPR
jgi:WD40 repeat protein